MRTSWLMLVGETTVITRPQFKPGVAPIVRQSLPRRKMLRGLKAQADRDMDTATADKRPVEGYGGRKANARSASTKKARRQAQGAARRAQRKGRK